MQKRTLSHVSFIMDGNRRWAKKNLLNISRGHTQGSKQIEPIVKCAIKKNIDYVTFWALSRENWERPKEEVSILMDVFRHFLNSDSLVRLKKNNVKCNVIGDISIFPEDIRRDVSQVIIDTQHNNAITMNIALNYSGRDEVLSAINRLLSEGKKNISEKEFSGYLLTKSIPDPDLIIRTGGEYRLSGFMPWQSVYSELYFTKTYWPDFTDIEFEEITAEFFNRQRRFGH